MKIISKREIIKKNVERYISCYGASSTFGWKIRSKQLKKLNLDTCSNEDIESIIEDISWTSFQCNECKEEVENLVELGEESDYGSKTTQVCLNCVKKSLKLFEEKSPQ